MKTKFENFQISEKKSQARPDYLFEQLLLDFFIYHYTYVVEKMN